MMLSRVNALTVSRTSQSNKNGGKHQCCKQAASALFFSVGTGVAVAATAFGEDRAPVQPPAAARSSVVQDVAPEVKCPIARHFGVPCMFGDPMGFSLHLRDKGVAGISRTRAWLKSAADTTQSPGVIASGGAVSAAAALLAVPAPVLWFAGLSMFSIGALDTYIDIRADERVRARNHAAATLRAEARGASAPALLSSSSSAIFDHVVALGAFAAPSVAKWAASAATASSTAANAANAAAWRDIVARQLPQRPLVIA